jgi:preprotein translocase subunit SecA
VLNAKQHEREATIVAQAGRKGSVTVATNMAGRGTDIMLGGNAEFTAVAELRNRGLDPAETPEEYEAAWPDALKAAQESVVTEHDEVVGLGGLYVLGTERHESRRIDNQLRGRSGRQGDPGESRFYLSLADDLMRLFNSGMVESFLTAAKVPDDVPIESRMVTRAIASAQSQVEGRNFEIRKNVLKYDDVLNRQREVIYGERRRVLEGADLQEQIRHFVDDVVRGYVTAATSEGFADDWDLEQLWQAMKTLYPTSITLGDVIEEAGERAAITQEMLLTELIADAQLAYDRREQELGEETMRELERRVVLSVLDRKWREHLYEMDYLQEGIGLRAMAQRDPLVEYQREGYLLFQAMTEAIKEESIGYLFHVEVEVPAEPELGSEAPVLVAKGLVSSQRPAQLQYSAPSVDGDGGVEVHGENGAAVRTDDTAEGAANRASRRSAKKKRR